MTTISSQPPILDLRGLKCPLPVLRTRKALRLLPPGGEIVVLATDPLAGLDIPHMAAEDGHRLLRRWHEGEATAFHLAKGGAAGRTRNERTPMAPNAEPSRDDPSRPAARPDEPR